MKKFVLTAILVLVTVSTWAQVTNPFDVVRSASKKQLQEQNLMLRSSIDSLLMVVDSLRTLNLLEDVVEESTSHKRTPAVRDFNMADHDSLLAMWYSNSKAVDFDTVHDYDMDVVRFTSNVSDEELMKRLTDMNAFITLPFNETVKNYMVLYSEKMNAKMGRLLGLSAYYFPIIEEVLAKYDLPLELKYMAIIESSLIPTATSRAGAKGMWQFMYKTAVSYGLQIDSYVDERMDVEKSVDAAARYLRDSYRVFGDWSLAISSYNCGAGNVSKAIRRAGGKTDFWSIYDYLPRETRGYMPAFVGAMYAMNYYREYGIQPQDVGMPAQTDTFEIRKKLHFAQINEVVGVPMDDIRNLNPQYLHDILPGTEKAPCVLRLPFNWTGPFLEADQDSLYTHRAKELFEASVDRAATGGSGASGDRISYKVKKGDTLGKIAAKNHTTVAKIKSWNHLRSDSIRVGQVLYIYPNGVPSKSTTSSSSSSSGSSSAPASTPAAASAASAVPDAPAAAAVPDAPAVSADASVSEPTGAEAVAGAETSAGAETVVGAEEGESAEGAAAVETVSGAVSGAAVSGAEAVREAAEVRTDHNVNAWYSNLESSGSETKTEETVSESKPVEQPKPASTVYVVKSGDSLYSISKKYAGVSVQDIQNANNLSGTAIKVGQKLQIPVKQ